MLIRAGFEISYTSNDPTPMILMLNVHPSRDADLQTPDSIRLDPPIPFTQYVDGFGNRCTRIVTPLGRLVISADTLVRDSGLPDEAPEGARQHLVQDLPDETLVFLLGSRYCETDKLTEGAWAQFGHLAGSGWPLAQAICDYVHDRIAFGYPQADRTRTALEASIGQQGVCRDYAHLAVALCRCMNVPARYCTGYLGDIGVPPVPSPMDFSAWFEVYLGERWYTFDARHNVPRIGRIVMARGRDATDVAMVTSFGGAWLSGFRVVTDEVREPAA
jgi:transglutaminase-like putative cysteine protease